MDKSKETKVKNPLLEEEVESTESETEEVKTPVAKRRDSSEKQLLSDIELTKRNLEAEDKVMFLVPLAVGEKPGAVHECFVNGYKYEIKKGVMTQIPRSIAVMLGIHYQIESEAGSGFRIDRDPSKQNALDA